MSIKALETRDFQYSTEHTEENSYSNSDEEEGNSSITPGREGSSTLPREGLFMLRTPFQIADTQFVSIKNRRKKQEMLLGSTSTHYLESTLSKKNPLEEDVDKYFSLHESLNKNLMLAIAIQDYVKYRIPFSANYRNRVLEDDISPPEGFDVVKEILYVREGETGEEQLLRSLQRKAGNCGEMVRVGLQCPAIQNTRVESIEFLAPGDHMFLLIGRDQENTFIGRDQKDKSWDPKQWNEDAVICDVWAGMYFPAFLAEKYLIYPCKTLWVRDLQTPAPQVYRMLSIVRLYDPASDHLVPVCNPTLEPCADGSTPDLLPQEVAAAPPLDDETAHLRTGDLRVLT